MAVVTGKNQKTAEDIQVANSILRQIGSLNWVSLDIDGGFIFVEDSGVSLRNVVVGRRKRGMIDIMVNPVTGFHDIKVTQFTERKGNKEIQSWSDVPTSGIRRLLADLWM